MAAEAKESPAQGKLVIRNIGLALSGDIDAPVLDADTIVVIDGRIAEIGGAHDVDTGGADSEIDAQGCAV